ncbi:hypothetical protein SAMN05421770_10345 [Granulicella rosea]|uniref:Uncharacterized protein n=1 Tax=Granulicella rosea TaxID=474952 RepID=A0A239IFJ6_9BACT|nr:hypothetical protein [Granulicella rosea]SNS91194.1 hypothetical protein SAMN05421770_10345 [Granulicella rosea]
MKRLALVVLCLSLGWSGEGSGQTGSQTESFAVPPAHELAQTLEALRDPASSAPLDQLYARGLEYAAAQQLNGESRAAAGTAQSVEAALATAETLHPATLEIEEKVAAARRRYALLGKPLPALPLAESLFAANETPRINRDYGSATILLAFPDSCSLCVEMARGLRAALFRDSDRNVRLYGLLAQPTSPVAAAGAPPIVPDPRSPVARLRGTPTLTVPPGTLQVFGATDRGAPEWPLAIATDCRGIVRFVGPAPLTALLPGGFVDRLAEHLAKIWPQDASKPARK